MVVAPTHISMNEYWYASLNLNIEMYAEDWAGETERPAEPLKFKPYRGVARFPLGDHVPQQLGDMRSSFQLFRQRYADLSCCDPLDGARLSRLFYYSFGISRLDVGPAVVWPYHRFVPSPRAFFPTELYAWIPRNGDLPAGVYYYDPAHHALMLLRQGDYVDYIGAATGANLSDASAILFLTSVFWKNAFLYRNYTYRVAPQEIGILAGNVLMVAGALGLHGHVHHQFLDHPLNLLLGVESPEESVMLVLPVFDRQREPALSRPAAVGGVASDAPPLMSSVQAIDAEVVRTSLMDRRACAKLVDLHSQALLTDTRQLVAPAVGPSLQEPAGAPVVQVPDDPAPPVIELADALRARTSGMWIFNSCVRTIAAEDLWCLLRYALHPHASDVAPPGDPPLVECFALVNKVADVASGIYRLRRHTSALESWWCGPVAQWLQALHLIRPPQINYASTNVVIFLIVNREELTRCFGSRGFRIGAQEAGIVAERVCAMGASVGLTVRVHNGYKASAILDLLGVDSNYAPVFQLVVGTARPTARYQMPVVV